MKLLKGVAAAVVIVTIAWVSYGLFAAPKEAAVEPAAGGEMGGGQPMPVKVATLTSQEVQLWHTFSGKLVAVDTVDIRPRVGGTIDKIYFQPGEIVEKDAPLFLIDPRPYQAEVNRLAAALTVAQTQAVLANSEAERSQRLIKENALSQREFDERQNNKRVAQANITAANAALQQAKLNLTYATITSPIRGKISRAEITQGNLVDPASPQILTTVVSIDAIYADFDIDEPTYLKSVRQKSDAEGLAPQTPVQLVLSADQSVVYDGKIVAFDNQLDSNAGTIRARAIFDNKDQALIPGMFAEIRLGNAEKQQAVLIPDRIVNTDQDKKFVYAIDDKSNVAYRPVKLGQTVNGLRVVEEGLAAGDRVVVKGIQRLRPGMPVAPTEVPLIDNDNAADQPPEAVADTAAKPEANDTAAPELKPADEVAPENTPAISEPTAEAMPEPVKATEAPSADANTATAPQPDSDAPAAAPAAAQ